jgi:hypothetical protein
MVPVTVAVTVSDDLDPTPVCQITNVTSNDSSPNSDWTVTAPLRLQLRADRSGLGGARVYSITVTCTNASMLSATALVTVVVPHDQR